MIDIPKFIRSLGYAFKGIFALINSENNAKIHFLATILAVSLGIYFNISADNWNWILLAIVLVWITEAINTSIESVVDLAAPDLHPLAKRAKDIAAGAVLIAAGFAVYIGVKVFLL
jgi:diacylglycerol kinase